MRFHLSLQDHRSCRLVVGGLVRLDEATSYADGDIGPWQGLPSYAGQTKWLHPAVTGNYSGPIAETNRTTVVTRPHLSGEAEDRQGLWLTVWERSPCLCWSVCVSLVTALPQ